MADPITPSTLVRELDETKFLTLVHESPKQVREVIFQRLGIKEEKTATSRFAKPGQKTEQMAKKLYAAMQDEDDDEVAEELLRNYFLKRRPLLAAALDFLKIPHEDGLTNDELDKFEKLTKDEAQKLYKKLAADHDPIDVALYLKFMKVPKGFEKAA